MDMNIDLKVKLTTPDNVERLLIVTVNPFTVAKSKELAVRVEEVGKDGATKLLGKTDLKLGSFLNMAKQAKGGE